jgi:hypothetical protein
MLIAYGQETSRRSKEPKPNALGGSPKASLTKTPCVACSTLRGTSRRKPRVPRKQRETLQAEVKVRSQLRRRALPLFRHPTRLSRVLSRNRQSQFRCLGRSDHRQRVSEQQKPIRRSV